MTDDKRFTLEEIDCFDYGIKVMDIIKDNGIELPQSTVCDLLNQLSDENEELMEFQEQVASVIEGKMGDNVCNNYKMEVLEEIWNELELDDVWFE